MELQGSMELLGSTNARKQGSMGLRPEGLELFFMLRDIFESGFEGTCDPGVTMLLGGSWDLATILVPWLPAVTRTARTVNGQ